MKECFEEEKTREVTYKVVGWTWWGDSDYVEAPLSDKVVEAVAKEIREHGYCFGGDSHQRRDGCVPLLSTGQVVRCSMREWGALMAHAVFDGNHFPLDYMGWYMDCCINDSDLKYPEENVDESLFTHPRYFKTGMTATRFDSLCNDGKVINVLATSEEEYNVEEGDVGVYWPYEGRYAQVMARVVKIQRFDSPTEFISSDLFAKTDLFGLEGDELMTAINSTRNNCAISPKDGVTCYFCEYIDKMLCEN